MKTNKQAIADSFSRSATRYDNAAQVQQASGRALIQSAQDYIDIHHVSTLADIGCGTGYLTRALSDAFDVDRYIGVDLATGMLDVASSNNIDLAHAEWTCGDAENLPLGDASVDLLYANFSLQWCQDLPKLLENFHRVLTQNGYCCFTSLGEETLYEMRDAWHAVDQMSHVNQFENSQSWLQAIDKAGFSCVKKYQTREVSYFDTVKEALRSLKDIGANVVTDRHRQTLTGKQRFNDFVRAYENHRTDKGIPVTYIVDAWVIKK